MSILKASLHVDGLYFAHCDKLFGT